MYNLIGKQINKDMNIHVAAYTCFLIYLRTLVPESVPGMKWTPPHLALGCPSNYSSSSRVKAVDLLISRMSACLYRRYVQFFVHVLLIPLSDFSVVPRHDSTIKTQICWPKEFCPLLRREGLWVSLALHAVMDVSSQTLRPQADKEYVPRAQSIRIGPTVTYLELRGKEPSCNANC